MTRSKNSLRIVGGRFRGRRVAFPDQPGLRPTSDRVRETLFNWLTPAVVGARCLDAFAGSGALGLEAASRGAAEVVMLERASNVARQLARNAETLGASLVRVHQVDALQWLSQRGRGFDIVFLDPPFADGLLPRAMECLERYAWLAPGALVYLEAPAPQGIPPLPPRWELIRDKSAGQVRYGLAVVREPATQTEEESRA